MIQIKTGLEPAERATLDAPLDHLMACHRRIGERLATLERAGASLEDRRDEALAAIRSAFAFMESNGAIHTRDEEDSIFPRLRGRMTADETLLVDELEDDHLEADGRYARLKTIVARLDTGEDAADEFRQAASALCALYRKHIETEDSALVAIARRELTGEQLAAISAEMKKRRGLS